LGTIKKNISELKQFKQTARDELIEYIKKNLKPTKDPTIKVDRFIDYFTILPVDMDPNGIISKVRHFVRSREDTTRSQVRHFSPEINEIERSKIQTLLEIATSLQLLYKIVNHMFLTAKKQNNYPLILPLQMFLPFIMEEANALKDAISAFKQGQPIGDGIGPMIVGKMMVDTTKQTAALETIWSKTEINDRTILLMKAEGPQSTVGRPGDAIEKIVSNNKIDCIIMIDASIKLEGEESASVAQGFGAAIGGIGTDRFQIEEVATKHKIPIYAIIIKQSVKEAITLMTKEISEQSENILLQIKEMINENTDAGQKVLVVGVGNTSGIGQ